MIYHRSLSLVYLSQLYSAIVPSLALSSEGLNVTVLWAGAPGKPQPEREPAKKESELWFYWHIHRSIKHASDFHSHGHLADLLSGQFISMVMSVVNWL